MITPFERRSLGQGSEISRNWVHAALTYSLGGALSAGALGGLLGAIGKLLHNFGTPRELWLVFAVWAGILGFRDVGVLSFPLPQRQQQAPYHWVRQFDYFSVLFMWGFFIGTGVSTYIVFGGLYAVLAASVVSGSIGWGSALLIAYWSGRSMSVWLAPFVERNFPHEM